MAPGGLTEGCNGGDLVRETVEREGVYIPQVPVRSGDVPCQPRLPEADEPCVAGLRDS